MKKILTMKLTKKGFTLIELLAVILILGIIALIAIPTINDIIASARKGAFERTGDALVKAIQEECTTNMIKGADYNIAYSFSDDETSNINVKGKLPSSGGVMITDDECNVSLNISDGNYCMVKSAYSDKTITGTIVDGACMADEIKDATCTSADTNPGTFGGIGTLADPYLIESIEDLYAIKLMTQEQTANKHFKLNIDLDFKDDCSYSNPSNTTYGNINQDGETKGMKEEITTGRGFIYSGATPNIFAGNFDGGNHIIRNLFIKGTGENNYAGLFERIENTSTLVYFKNIMLENVNINNINSKVGGLIGVIEANTNINVNNINVSGNISAAESTGGVIGESNSTSGSIFNNIKFNGNVRCTNRDCGGILGIQNDTVAPGSESIKMNNVKSIANVMAERNFSIVVGTAKKIAFNNIYAYGKLTNTELTNSWQGWMGAIAGEYIVDKNYSLNNLYNYANIELERYVGFVGGIFGELSFPNYEEILSSERVKLNKAYNYGNMQLDTWGDVAGLIGATEYTECLDCYNYGDVLTNMNNGQGDVIGAVFGGVSDTKCTNCANYGDIIGLRGVIIIRSDEIYNSVNYGDLECNANCKVFNGNTIINSYSIGNIKANIETRNFSGSLRNGYAVSDIYLNGYDINVQTSTYNSAGLGTGTAENAAFIGKLTMNPNNDPTQKYPTWEHGTDLIDFYPQNLINVYSVQTGGDESRTNGISTPFSSVTTSWFRDTVNLGNNFLYEEEYYPRVYKLDVNGNVTNELVEGQLKIPIR